MRPRRELLFAFPQDELFFHSLIALAAFKFVKLM